MKNIFTGVFALLVCLNSYAGTANGKVKQIIVHTGDIIMFDLGSHDNKPQCSTVGTEWALSLSSEKGKAMYALLLSASAQDKTLVVYGDETCNAWGDRESPHMMIINY